jgi:hypothetical protein
MGDFQQPYGAIFTRPLFAFAALKKAALSERSLGALVRMLGPANRGLIFTIALGRATVIWEYCSTPFASPWRPGASASASGVQIDNYTAERMAFAENWMELWQAAGEPTV